MGKNRRKGRRAAALLAVAQPARRPAEPADPLRRGLSDEQWTAVSHGRGPLLITAGPGSGKTRVLTRRICWLLESGLAEPWEVLAVSFSVRAAEELKARLRDMLGVDRSARVRAATLHSLSARLLRHHVAAYATASVYDQVETRRTIDWLASDRQSQRAVLAGLGIAANDIEARITQAKNRLIPLAEYERQAADETEELVAGVWRRLEQEMRTRNAVTFTDLLVHAIDLLATRPHVLAEQRRRARWLLVDEVQDLNRAQLELICLLGAPDGNVTVVGDPDQVVYGFQSADAGGMRRLAERFPGHTKATLRRNYRSHAEILTAASRCVRHNTNRDATVLLAQRGAGGSVTVRGFADDQAEADWATRQIRRALAAGFPPEEILILCRKMHPTKPVQQALRHAGIEHRVVGQLGLYELAPVKAAVAHLALLANPCDVDAFTQTVTTPRRGIGEVTIRQLVTIAREDHRGDLIVACASPRAQQTTRGEAAGHLGDLATGFATARNELAGGERSLATAASTVLMIPGGLVASYEHVRDHDPDTDRRRKAATVLEDLRSVISHIHSYEQQDPEPTLTGFLELIAGLGTQQIEPGETDRRVTISTIHRAKGGEAQLVILLACEEGVLPAWQAIESADADQLEEERRLMYVAMTRAKDALACSYAEHRGGRQTNGASRFLAEAGLLQDDSPVRQAA